MSKSSVQDGLGELRVLADRVFTALGETGYVPSAAEFGNEVVYWGVAYTYSRIWPRDKAAQLLAAWRTETAAS